MYVTHIYAYVESLHDVVHTGADRSDLREPKTKVDKRGRESHDLSGRRLVREISCSSEFPVLFIG